MTLLTLIAQLREKAAASQIHRIDGGIGECPGCNAGDDYEELANPANLTVILDAFGEMRAALEWALDNADLSLADGNSRKLERRMNEVLQRLDAEIGGGK